MIAHSNILAFLQSVGPMELIVVGIVALLIFGRRLPEVGRSLGRGIVEFKKGLRETGDEINQIASDTDRDPPRRAVPPSAMPEKRDERKEDAPV